MGDVLALSWLHLGTMLTHLACIKLLLDDTRFVFGVLVDIWNPETVYLGMSGRVKRSYWPSLGSLLALSGLFSMMLLCLFRGLAT